MRALPALRMGERVDTQGLPVSQERRLRVPVDATRDSQFHNTPSPATMSSDSDAERLASAEAAEAGPSSGRLACARQRSALPARRGQPPPPPPSGERGDVFRARINSRSGGGAAGPRTRVQQQPRVEVTVRLDVRLPALSGKALQVPGLSNSFAYRTFHVHTTYQGVGRGARPAAEPISEANRFSKFHCGRCMKPLSEHPSLQSAQQGRQILDLRRMRRGAARVRRAGQRAVWDCPTAAEGGSGCKCWCADAKKQQVVGGK
jgi:hypothetical protein